MAVVSTIPARTLLENISVAGIFNNSADIVSKTEQKSLFFCLKAGHF
jgi:hypothetical protein